MPTRSERDTPFARREGLDTVDTVKSSFQVIYIIAPPWKRIGKCLQPYQPYPKDRKAASSRRHARSARMRGTFPSRYRRRPRLRCLGTSDISSRRCSSGLRLTTTNAMRSCKRVISRLLTATCRTKRPGSARTPCRFWFSRSSGALSCGLSFANLGCRKTDTIDLAEAGGSRLSSFQVA